MTANLDSAAKKLRENVSGSSGKAASVSPLQESVQRLVGSVTDKAVSAVSDKVLGATGRLNDYAEGGGGGGGLLSAVTGAEKSADGKSSLKSAFGAGMTGVKESVKEKASDLKDAITGGGGGGKGKGKKLKIANIVETIDVGVPRQVAYDQWTQFEEFPHFMKKLERVEQVEDEKLQWKGQVFWSHRTWESTIVEQVPPQRIVWRSKGAKGYVDGAITFHDVTPDLTRILALLEYHPHGLFEKTGMIWRAQGRRMRLELKHFQRHVMTQTILRQDEIEGWPGEIRESHVVEPEESDDYDEEPIDDEGAGDEDLSDEETADEPDTAEDETTEDEEPQDEEPQDEEPQDEEPQNEEPQNEEPQDEEPEDEEPEDEAPGDETDEGDEAGKEPERPRRRPRTRDAAGTKATRRRQGAPR